MIRGRHTPVTNGWPVSGSSRTLGYLPIEIRCTSKTHRQCIRSRAETLEACTPQSSGRVRRPRWQRARRPCPSHPRTRPPNRSRWLKDLAAIPRTKSVKSGTLLRDAGKGTEHIACAMRLFDLEQLRTSDQHHWNCAYALCCLASQRRVIGVLGSCSLPHALPVS